MIFISYNILSIVLFRVLEYQVYPHSGTWHTPLEFISQKKKEDFYRHELFIVEFFSFIILS